MPIFLDEVGIDMEIIDAVKLRQSVRAFKSEPVSKEVLKEILEIATRSPSTMNTQPWEMFVIAGQAIDVIKRKNIESLNFGMKQEAEVPLIPFVGKYRQRQVNLAIEIFRLMEIPRENRQMREKWQQRGFRFFDAPAGIIITLDKSLEQSLLSLLDIGALMQTICLVALNYGLATCIEDQAIMFPEVIRKVIGVPETKRIIIAIAIGYPDWNFPANRLKSSREPIESIVTWHGFD